MKTLHKAAPFITAAAVAVLTILRHNNYTGAWNIVLWALITVCVILISIKLIRNKETRPLAMVMIGGLTIILLFFLQYG